MLTIVVNFFNMRREAERTLYTLSTEHQIGVSDNQYQVIAVDNGSSSPLTRDFVTRFGRNFEYQFFDTLSPSPAAAINWAVQKAKSGYVSVIVDGARMATPRLVRYTLDALEEFKHPFVCALSWHLGPNIQALSMLEGYNQLEEDKLLNSINWKSNGYRLFDISTIAPSSNVGFYGGYPDECSWLSMERSMFFDVGGFDERFQTPGGGLVNHEFLSRIIECKRFEMIALIGEGVFHQFHGGAITGTRKDSQVRQQILDEYRVLHGKQYKKFRQPDINYVGHIPLIARKFTRMESD